MIPTEGRERGEKRAERGIRRAAYKHEPHIRRGMMLFLDALLASPDGCSSLDAATDDQTRKHADGGKWRASIPKRLKAIGLIVGERVVKSSRPPRHAGYLTEWRLVDRPAAVAMRAALAAQQQMEAVDIGDLPLKPTEGEALPAALDVKPNATGSTSGIVEPVSSREVANEV